MAKKSLWRRGRNNVLICTHSDACEYYVDLDDCNNSAEILDWIIQIAKKSWCTDEILSSLVHNLDDIIDIQGTICSNGIDVTTHIKRMKESSTCMI